METIENKEQDKPIECFFNKNYILQSTNGVVIIARTHSVEGGKYSAEIIQQRRGNGFGMHKRECFIWEAVNGLKKEDCSFDTESEAEEWLDKFAKNNHWDNFSYAC